MSVDHPLSETSKVNVGLTDRWLSWRRRLIVIGVLAGIWAFTGLFYKQTYVGVTDRDTEDIAQIARNIAEDHGFTTRFIRPFNAGLGQSNWTNAELNHAPLFPYVVSTLFILKGATDQTALWPGVWFFCLTAVAVYFLGRLLFDWRAGLLAAVIFGVSAPLLRIGMSGGLWPMAALWFTLLLHVVALHHRASADEESRSLVYAALGGIMLALLYYTHHVMIFLIIPMGVYFAVTGGARKLHLIAFLVVTALAISPWVYRNYELTGSPVLGVNAWDLVSNTRVFPGDTFYHSADPVNRQLQTVLLFPLDHFAAFAGKLTERSVDMADALIPMLGLVGLAFAVVSVLYRFKNAQANAVRGLMYTVVPVMIACFAVFGVATSAVILFAPAAAVLASAYFLLLLDARKLHPFYTKALIGGFILITAAEAMTLIAFPRGDRRTDIQMAADSYFAALGNKGAGGTIYTDVPWIAAWRSKCIGIWLPMSDKDAYAITASGFSVPVVILTPESDSYSRDEIWSVLHRVRLWREYILDPESGLKDILKQAGQTSDKAASADKALKRLQRNYSVSQVLANMKILPQDPLAPDDIQIFSLQAQ